MSKKSEATYEAWIKELEASEKFNAEQKAALKVLTEGEAGKELFGGHLREKDYYTKLNEHQTKKDELEREKAAFAADLAKQSTWFQKAKPEYDRATQEAEALKAKLASLEKTFRDAGLEPPAGGTVTSKTANDDVTLRELNELRQHVQFMDKMVPQLAATVGNITRRSLKDGFEVDVNDVLKLAAEKQIDPATAYERLTQADRDKQNEAAREKEKAQWIEEGRKQALSKLSGPDRIRPAAPSLVDALRGASGGPEIISDPRARVDAAVKAFAELEAAGTAT